MTIRSLLSLPRLQRFTLLSGVYLVVAVPLVFNELAYDTALWEKLIVAHIVALRFALAWCLHPGRWRLEAFDIPLLMLLAWFAASWTMAINPVRSGLEVIRVLLVVVLYAAVARTYRPSFLGPWTGAIGIALAVVSFLGVCQYLGLGFTEIRSAGMPSATFLYRNFAAMYVVSALPVAVARFLVAERDGEAWAWAVVGGLASLFLLYTRTRGAWVGFGSALGAAALFLVVTKGSRPWRLPDWTTGKRAAAVTCVSLVCVCSSIPPLGGIAGEQLASAQKEGVATAVVSILEGQHSGRLAAWTQSLKLISDHWLVGVGVGNWALVYPRYAGETFASDGGMFFRPHNDYLWVVSELGVVGLLLAGWVVLSIVRVAIRCLTRMEDTTGALVLLGMMAGLVALSGHAFFSFPKERPATLASVSLYLGILAATWRSVRDETREPSFPRGAAWGALVICALALIPVGRAVAFSRHHFRTDLFRFVGRFDASLREAQAAKRLGIVDARIYEFEGFALQKLGRVEEAYRSRIEGLAYHPNNPWSLHAVGVYAQELGRHRDALPMLERAAQLAPRVGVFHRELGLSQAHLGRANRAAASFDRALALMPNDPLTQLEASTFAMMTGDTARAHAHLAVASEKIGNERGKLLTLGRYALGAREGSIAEDAFNRALDIKDGTDAIVGLARAQAMNGRADEAAALLRGRRFKVDDQRVVAEIEALLLELSRE